MAASFSTILLLLLLATYCTQLIRGFDRPSCRFYNSLTRSCPMHESRIRYATECNRIHNRRLRPQRVHQRSRRRVTDRVHPLHQSNVPYGRGAEIWPEPPRDEVIVLADSFPNGEIPFVAVASIGEADIMDTIHQQVVAGTSTTLTKSDQQNHRRRKERRHTDTSSGSDSPVDVVDGSGSSSPSGSSEAVSSNSQQQQQQPRTRSGRSGRKRDSLRRILRRAAAKEELDAESSGGDDNEIDNNCAWGEPSSWPFPFVVRLFGQGVVGIRKLERTPAITVASLLVGMGWVRPFDIAVTSLITTYIVVLTMAARSYRDDSYVPYMPATPPQGHVPAMVINPLGRNLVGLSSANSATKSYYDTWLRIGAMVGFVIPTVWTMLVIIASRIPQSMINSTTQSGAIGLFMSLLQKTAGFLADTSLSSPFRACSRHLFLLCCQIMTEATTKRRITVTPLPIRILVPCLYNIVRLAFLWMWVQTSFAQCVLSIGNVTLKSLLSSPSTPSLVLAVLNMIYWSANLFGFLIPVAIVRYMRAYFFAVEAEEVTTRQGLEETLGMIPNFHTGGVGDTI